MLILRPSLTMPPTASGGAPAISAWHWARLDDAGATVLAQGRAGSEALGELGSAQTVALLVPSAWIAWHLVRWPGGRPARQAEVLAGLLEEHLLQEPALMHWAIGPQGPDGPGSAWVAALRDADLAAAVATVEALGWTVQRLVAETAPCPTPRLWAHLLDGAPRVELACDHGVFSAPLVDASPVCGWLLDDPTPIQAWADPACYDLARATLPALPWQVLSAVHVWRDALNSGVDLAQFLWRRRVGGGGWQRAARALREVASAPAWTGVRWGLGVAAFVGLVGLPLVAWQAQRAEQALRAETLRVARQALPGTPVLLDPVRQLQQALQRAAPVPPPTALERWLHVWGTLGGAAPQRIELEDTQLTMTWSTPVPPHALQRAALAAELPPPQGDGATWRWVLQEARP